LVIVKVAALETPLRVPVTVTVVLVVTPWVVDAGAALGLTGGDDDVGRGRLGLVVDHRDGDAAGWSRRADDGRGGQRLPAQHRGGA
jgi:hypothetical protein